MTEDGNLVLTGFMATGKTSVGRILARLLDMEFVDTDDLIESRHGPIPEIFERHGEARFREIERSVVAELSGRSGLVVATGGGTVLDSENERVLTRRGRVFCLVASPETIQGRVLSDPSGRDRPMLSGEDPAQRVAELMVERSHGYSRFEQIETDGRSPESIADEIVGLWRR